jgi:hypothetical protein
VGLFFLTAIAHGARRLHGSRKLAGEGRLWMMRWAPLISIAAKSVSMKVILPPDGTMPDPDGFRRIRAVSTDCIRCP